MKPLVPFFCFVLLLSSSIVRGQNLFVEPFTNGFGGNGWTVESGWVTGTSATLSSADFTIPAHNTFACLNDDAAGQIVLSEGSIISPAIDLAGIDAALLTFAAFFLNGDYGGNNEIAQVYISTDSMATWSLLYDLPGQTGWAAYKLFIGEPYTGHVVHLAFKYDDGGAWNFGFCVDDVLVKVAEPYDAEIQLLSTLEYTILTPNQLRQIKLVHSIKNFGAQSLGNVSFVLKAKLNNVTVDEFTHVLNDVPGGAIVEVLDTFVYFPSQIGAYTFQILASHPELGSNFYFKTYGNAFKLDSALMARDDNQADIYIGMSGGSPNWYGYYGSEFDLINDDTLVGIDIMMGTTTAGSFNLVVAVKDEEGLPTDELFHSEKIPIGANFTGWVHFPLPTPMMLDSGNYVFAVGQDTVQGVMGHGMDTDRQNLGYWITSPVAGGGYPWTNYDSPDDPLNYTLMIRPKFKVQTTSSTELVQNESDNIRVYPNPATDKFVVQCEDCPGNWMTLYDLTGRFIQNIKMTGITTDVSTAQLEAGTYLLRVTGKNGNRWKKVVIGDR